MAVEGIKVEGVRELTRAIKNLDPLFEKGIKLANRVLGEEIIAAAQPKPLAVGSGTGATPKAAGSRNYVAIKAGGSHRTASPVQPWGRTAGPRRDTPRPFILGSAIDAIPDIEDRYLSVLVAAAESVGLEARRD